MLFTALITALESISNISKSTPDGPERGMFLTANFFTLIPVSSATAAKTASPKPP